MASPTEFVRHRPEPRITANDLARYMVSGETGKLGIIRRSREAVTPTVTRYSELRKTIRGFVSDMTRHQGVLAAARSTFEQNSDDASLSDFAREDAKLSMDALDHFTRMQNLIAGYRFEPVPARQPSLTLAGVEVSVNVDALVTRMHRDGDQIGGALFRFTKADDETDAAASKRREMGSYAATLVQMHVRQNLAGNRQPHYQLCLSIDVQCREVHVAPRTFIQRAQNLESACRFIAALWDAA